MTTGEKGTGKVESGVENRSRKDEGEMNKGMERT